MSAPKATGASLVFALAFTMMLGPFSLDTYLPAFPQMAADFGVDTQTISLSVSVYIFTIAFSQLLGGALSDRLGRKVILFFGLGLYMLSSFWIATVDSMSALLSARVLQAIGGGCVIVSIPALIRDRVKGQQAAKLFSMIGLIAVVAPAIAPSIGGLLLGLGSWRLIFWMLGIYAVCVIPLLRFTVFATPAKGAEPAPKRVTPTGSLLQQYLEVLRTAGALRYIFWQGCCFSVLMIFVTNASYIYQVHYEQSEHMFSLLFAANIFIMFGTNVLNRVLLGRLHSIVILRAGTFVQAVAATLLLITALSDGPLWTCVLTIMMSVGMMAAVGPNMQACYLEGFGHNSGTASALMGAAQFGFAGCMSALSTMIPGGVIGIAAMMCLCALGAASMALLSLREPTPPVHKG